MTMTNEDHRELIRNMNAQADGLARHAENAGDARAIVEVTTANTEALILLGRIIEPLTAKIVKALDAEQRERDEAEPKREYCHGCADCPFGKYVTHMVEGAPQQSPFCWYPDADEERAGAGRLGLPEENLPTDPPDDCPLAVKDLLVILDV